MSKKLEKNGIGKALPEHIQFQGFIQINSGVSFETPFMGEEKPDESLWGNVSLLRGCLRHG